MGSTGDVAIAITRNAKKLRAAQHDELPTTLDESYDGNSLLC